MVLIPIWLANQSTAVARNFVRGRRRVSKHSRIKQIHSLDHESAFERDYRGARRTRTVILQGGKSAPLHLPLLAWSVE